MEHDNFQPALKASAGDFIKSSFNADTIFSEEERKYMQSYCLLNDSYNFNYED